MLRENQQAAAITRDDVRWLFAIRASNSLEGGRGAVLPPEKRRALVAEAVGAGLREFDANLVIAIVQDAARSGLQPSSPDVRSRLSMVPRPAPEADFTDRPLRMLLAATMGGLLLLALIRWLLS